MSTMDAMDRQYAQRLEAGEGQQLADDLGLHRIGARPKLGRYVASLWSRRQFLWTLSTANAYARNRDNYLGQVWNVLNPLLWAAVYGLVFGLLLDGRRGMTGSQYIPFLVTGVFIFRYMASCMTSGAKAISGNISLVRSLHFPRAVLPISVALAEFVILLPSLIVLAIIVAAFGQGPLLSWFLFPAAMLLVLMFATGLSLIMARLIVQIRDISNLLPFVTRLLLYTSGVFYAIDRFSEGFEKAGMPWLETVGMNQPFALYLNLARGTMTEFVDLTPQMWLMGVGYALLFLIGGFIFFWRAEERYGRD
jgi:teichoic acid transport system permease protein